MGIRVFEGTLSHFCLILASGVLIPAILQVRFLVLFILLLFNQEKPL